MSVTLNSACSSSSTGVSLSCPFRALPIAVRFANVTTTSFGFFSKRRSTARLEVDKLRVDLCARRRDSLASMMSGATSVGVRTEYTGDMSARRQSYEYLKHPKWWLDTHHRYDQRQVNGNAPVNDGPFTRSPLPSAWSDHRRCEVLAANTVT